MLFSPSLGSSRQYIHDIVQIDYAESLVNPKEISSSYVRVYVEMLRGMLENVRRNGSAIYSVLSQMYFFKCAKQIKESQYLFSDILLLTKPHLSRLVVLGI